MKKPIYVAKGTDAKQLSDSAVSPQGNFPLSSLLWPDPRSCVVVDTSAETRALASEIVAAIKDGQKRFEDLPPTWLTAEQAASYLNLSPDTIERLAASGKLKSAEVRTDRSKGKRTIRRFRRKWLNDFMKASCPPPPPPPPPPVAPQTRRGPKPCVRDYFE